jgi:hypothetical protein
MNVEIVHQIRRPGVFGVTVSGIGSVFDVLVRIIFLFIVTCIHALEAEESSHSPSPLFHCFPQ